MNIEILQDYIMTFTREVVDSGFKRDLDDYASSLPASQNNIVALRGIAEKILSVIDPLYSSDLPDGLKSLLPRKELRPFTETPYDSTLRELIEDTEIPQAVFFTQLTEFIDTLRTQIEQNLNEITKIKGFITPYLSRDAEQIAKEDLAIIAIVFNESQTISSLKEFTKNIQAWDRVLPIYHQLLKSESPKDIQIVEIQNGSIDFVVNLNVDVALDLVELFKVGFTVFGAYLSYKELVRPIVETYHGNKKLISTEEERENLLLENIGTAIKELIETQHKEAKKTDKKVDGTAVPKKVEQVANLIASHIVKGNDLKLLAAPTGGESKYNEENLANERDDLHKKSLVVRSKLRLIPKEARQVLLESYGTINDDKDNTPK